MMLQLEFVIIFIQVFLSPGIKNQPRMKIYFFKVICAQFYDSFNWLKVAVHLGYIDKLD